MIITYYGLDDQLFATNTILFNVVFLKLNCSQTLYIYNTFYINKLIEKAMLKCIHFYILWVTLIEVFYKKY